MSFLKKLFGGGSGTDRAASPAASAAEETYGAFRITATPMKDGVQYRLAGTVSQGTGEARREHRFVRADMFQSADEAAEAALRKGRQLVDEQGEALLKG